MISVYIPVSTVLCYMPLPIALYCELEAALIADKGFDTPGKKYINICIFGILMVLLVRSHVLLQESFS